MSKRNNYLLKRFGITEKQYDELYDKQRGCCAVCGRPAASFKRRLAVDHDHTTGQIRGLLCFNCNRFVVGRLRKANGAETLQKAYVYLTDEYTGWVVPPKKKRKKRRKKR